METTYAAFSLRKHTDIVFICGDSNVDILRLKANGEIWVKGKLVEEDKELVDGLRYFLLKCKEHE